MNMQKKTIDEILNETLKVLRDGGVILYPTDTVWGLGCDATNPEAVAKIYEIKHRSDSKSLVLLASSLDQIALYVNEIPPMAIDLVEVNDRPMTLIYPGAKTYPEPAEGEPWKADRYHLAHNTVAADGTVGIRIPMMEFCQQLTYKLGRPIVSTPVSLHRRNSPTSPTRSKTRLTTPLIPVSKPGPPVSPPRSSRSASTARLRSSGRDQ